MNDQLLQQISQTIGKSKILELSRILREQNFSLHDLIQVTFHADKNIAFRAAWIMENLFLRDPVTYLDELEYLVSRFKDVKHASCRRHYVKVMMHITNSKAPLIIKNRLDQIDLQPVAEQCFDWMIDPKVKIAVKIFAGDTLFNLRYRYPWINDELADQVRFLMLSGSPGDAIQGKEITCRLVNCKPLFRRRLIFFFQAITYLEMVQFSLNG